MSIRRSVLNPLLSHLGYRLERYQRDQPGVEPARDIRQYFRRSGRDRDSLIVFDVGANVGAFTLDIRENLPGSMIHAFEPDAATAQLMREHTADLPRVTINVSGLGDATHTAQLHQFKYHFMNSILPPGPAHTKHQPTGAVEVNMRTLDDYCREQDVAHINLLKTDTQGLELQVLRGGHGMLSAGAVELIYCEIIFSEIYAGMGRAHEIMAYLHEHGFELLAVYPTHHADGRAAWTDMLFVHKQTDSVLNDD